MQGYLYFVYINHNRKTVCIPVAKYKFVNNYKEIIYAFLKFNSQFCFKGQEFHWKDMSLKKKKNNPDGD